ncbi:MAG: gas vesicle protein [Streptosporangiales bacterium]|nr:gas vesicle protein [Streptosporangiales bacterium]
MSAAHATEGEGAQRKAAQSRRTEPRARQRPAEERPPGKDGLSAAKLAHLAVDQVVDLIGRDPEVVTSVERTEEGWRVGIEVVETHRIPDSADILAVYEADLDAEGDLLSYRRTRRYPRGRGQED